MSTASFDIGVLVLFAGFWQLFGVTPEPLGSTAWRGICALDPSIQITESFQTWGRGRRFAIVPLAPNKYAWFSTIRTGMNEWGELNYLFLFISSDALDGANFSLECHFSLDTLLPICCGLICFVLI